MTDRSVTPVDVRGQLVEALVLDLVGPIAGSSLADEALPQAPSRWYLTGFLAPLEASAEDRREEDSVEEVDTAGEKGGVDDSSPPEATAAGPSFYPSSMGMSLLVAAETEKLSITARWGDYKRIVQRTTAESSTTSAGPGGDEGSGVGQVTWKRTPREASIVVPLPAETTQPIEHILPDSNGLKLVISVRPVSASGSMVPAGTRSVSVFLVNWRHPVADVVRDEAFIFQAELEVRSHAPLVARPNTRGLDTDDWDERVADLQYRDAYEFAVGHGIATRAMLDADGHCRTLVTRWIPLAEVERVAPASIDGVELSMEALAGLRDEAEARGALSAVGDRYRHWIAAQREAIPASPNNRREIADELLRRAAVAADRIDAGIALLADLQVLEAFRTANRAMATAVRRRQGTMQGRDSAAVESPRWRLFQLAFILMNLPGIVDPTHADREVVDLLFFPTGGGKTEAYLGLAAFTLVLRRLRNPGRTSAGVSVLMRYTLRLLTLDQLSRAATLICALELERRRDPAKLGDWPFEIGLWVGLAATPNRMGAKGDPDSNSARTKTIQFINDDRKPAPIPLESCPWCGTKFNRHSFRLIPNQERPTDLRVGCVNRECEFSREIALPILGVDEPIYRRLPCFLIATVDKFAAMPWTGTVGAFFGRVDRGDANGFYGPCDPNQGTALQAPLPSPDLIIQDELHLVSGPMGTLVGLYESALDELCARTVNGRTVRPKIIASTATVRRAEKQIRALFNRRTVDIFPPPGPDRHDSFFAHVLPVTESNGRLYVGVAAQGTSPKRILLRTYLVLLAAAQRAWEQTGGRRNQSNAADPYMTLVGYFNSLRELGGSRRIVEDEVSTRLTGYRNRKRVSETEGLFVNRTIAYEVLELTSRVTTDRVADAKRRLALPFAHDERVDVALATNMISVGLDIVRLGLLVVFGQPKTSAEYIQATSRVGRDAERPGLVVTLFNIHKPRDRSHYERFVAYHESFYRSVEATSVTPFSPRALDRGFAGTLVALARHGHSPMTPPRGATEILNELGRLGFVTDALAARAESHSALPAAEAEAIRQRVRDRALDLFDEWSRIAHSYHNQGVLLQYQTETGGAQRLLYEFLNPALQQLPARHRKFRANRSLRDVEPSVNLWVRTLDDLEVQDDPA